MDPGAIACVVWLARSPQGQASVCARHTHWCVRCRVRTRRHTGCVRVPSGSHAGMCRLGPAPPWHSPPRPPLTPLPRVPQGRVGPGRPGNLSQLLCSVSGKPPAASVLPAEPTCLCTCPLGFQEGWGGGGGPAPSLACLSPQPRLTWWRGCATRFLSNLQSPSQLGRAEETQAEEGPSPGGETEAHTKAPCRGSQLSVGALHAAPTPNLLASGVCTASI